MDFYSMATGFMKNHAAGSLKGKQETGFQGRLTRSTPGWVDIYVYIYIYINIYNIWFLCAYH